MKIMNEYTYHYLKKNKRHTFSILVAIVIASTLLCALCLFLNALWQSQLTATISSGGNWHGELWQPVSGTKLTTLATNPAVEKTMTKGPWVTAQLSNTERPYFLMRDADEPFWKEMNMKNSLIEGRLPQREGEIVVSALFFTENPRFQLGDILELPVGNRMIEDKVLPTQAYQQDDETFNPVGTKTYTLVGSIDVSGVSANPGYIAMGYYRTDNLQESDELTVYIRLKNLRTVYETMPRLAKSVGLLKNEKNDNDIVYNTPLLNLYGISEERGANPLVITVVAMAITLLVLVMGTFILIIYNAFSLSVTSRSRELSILKSIGATPRQMKYSVLYEGFLLWLIQLPIGVLAGYGFTALIFSKMNEVLEATDRYTELTVSFSWQVVVLSLIASLVTVLLSAYGPAKKVSKLTAVEGITQNGVVIKKARGSVMGLFGIIGELAAKQYRVNQKSLRIAVISLSLSLILVASYLNIIAIFNLAESKNSDIARYDMSLKLNITSSPKEQMVNDILLLPEVEQQVVYRQARMTTHVTKQLESKEFQALGGLSSINRTKYNVVKEKTAYRIAVNVIGLSSESFENYCQKIGVASKTILDAAEPIGIMQDSTYHVPKKSNTVYQVPMLNLPAKTTLEFSETVFDKKPNDFNFDGQIAVTTDLLPGNIQTSRYSPSFILPMEKYQQIVSHFDKERQLETNRLIIDLLVGESDSVRAKEKITQIGSSYLGSEDFSVWSLLEEQKEAALVQQAISIGVYAVAILFAAVGIMNAFSSIANNLQLHKRDYALLRSVGLTPAGLNKLLFFEGLSFALKPIVVSLPWVIIICGVMLKVTVTSWRDFISILEIQPILFYLICLWGAIILAYWMASKSVKKGNIVNALKNESV